VAFHAGVEYVEVLVGCTCAVAVGATNTQLEMGLDDIQMLEGESLRTYYANKQPLIGHSNQQSSHLCMRFKHDYVAKCANLWYASTHHACAVRRELTHTNDIRSTSTRARTKLDPNRTNELTRKGPNQPLINIRNDDITDNRNEETILTNFVPVPWSACICADV